MQELEFTELDESGRLVVVAEDGSRYVVPVDDRLRAALRRRPPSESGGTTSASATPREIQSMIRAGQTAEEVAAATGWELERVRRFEGPVIAEREHVVGLAKAAHVRAQGRTDGSHTLERRVRERLQSRGVSPAETRWDAARTSAHGPWTVVVTFPAGGRERQATWHYGVQDRSIDALDDEARWLSEDEQALPGGLAGHPLLGGSHVEDEAADLMATMRERRQARGRRRRSEPVREDRPRPTGGIDNEPLPLEDLDYDPQRMGDPPAAHPRGSAPESPTPVAAPVVDDAAEEVEDEGRAASSRSRRERRRLRIPKLPPVPGEPEDEDTGTDDAELSYARTRDPQEVSFEEFFGTDEELLEVGDDELLVAEEEVLVVEDEVVVEVDDAPDVPDLAPDVPEDLEPDVPDVADEDPDVPEDLEPDMPDETPEASDDAPDEPEDRSAGQSGRRKGRPSVPSWDDIMFGGGGTRRRG
ncbi:hypothetical protein GCM10009584_21360 [Ornithinimicrobium humiphilum]|uniref:DUF3071 family protein n=1 Tax=Ornithinimicrobium humiphilum TaxID=125288 RepID=A0A543KNC6_9MICO|nr:septation protein SepH [Ornithinimicrobium humiphilum]TQM96569.1 DUF3071 family protein [Ornithinimicrobium humiphilum]